MSAGDDDKKGPAPRLGTADLEDPFARDGALPGHANAQDTTAPDLADDPLGAPPAHGDDDDEARARAAASEPTSAAGGATLTLAAGSAAHLPGRPVGPEDPRDEGHLKDRGVFARGGFGSIHAAYDTRLLRTVAMKVLEKDEPRPRLRFLQEGQVTAQLEHPNIVSVHEAGMRPGGLPFFTMQLVKGDTLTEVLRQADFEGDAATSLYTFLQIFERVCDALSFAHSRGVIHRDLKPDNIMVGSFGQVYVMDWGIALVTGESGRDGKEPDEQMVRREAGAGNADRPGTVVGTPSYMAPEQAQGRVEEIDERTDVFSLGAILYFALTGTPPYRGKTSREKLLRAQACAVERPEERAPDRRVPPGLRQITMRALSESPADRFQTVRELKDEVETFLRGGWWFEMRTFAPGEQILEEGGAADAAFIITAGSAEAYRVTDEGEMRLGTMGPGDVFGEAAILTDTVRSASVRALSPLSTMVVTRESIEEWFSADSWTGLIVKSLARRFREMEATARALQHGAPAQPEADKVRPAMHARPVVPRIELPVSRGLGVLEQGGDAAADDNPFGEDSGSFLDSGTVPLLIDVVQRGGDVDQAARLYEQSDGDLGPSLLEWARTAPTDQTRRLASLFEKARDFARAGRAHQVAGDFQQAASLFLKGDDWAGVAESYIGMGDRARAAEAFERAGDTERALELLEDLGLDAERGHMLLRAGRPFDAAAVFRELGDVATEITVLRRVPLHDASRVDAALRLASLMLSAQRYDEALAVLSDTLTAWHNDEASRVLGDGLVQVYAAMGRPEDGERVREWLREQHVIATADMPSEPLAAASDVDGVDVGAAVDRARGSDEGWEELKKLGVFRELSLADLKDLFVLCEERIFHERDALIQVGEDVGGVFVLLQGEADVTSKAGEIVNVVGPGTTLGEISLLRVGPATATVTARSPVRAIFIQRERFQGFLQSHLSAALAIHEHFARALAERVAALTG